MKRRSDSVEKRECMTIKRLKSIVKHLAMRACRRNLRLKESSRGYIFLLMCVAIPVLLYGVKHSVDIVSENRVKIYEGDMQGTIHKRCGKEAALEVARRWNPGLTFKQQKESILRVADDVYNRNPTYYNSVAHNAIPGLEIRKHKTTVGGASDPLNVTMENTGDVGQVLDSSSRTVKYTTQNGQNVREIFNYGGNQMFHRIMYGDDKDPNFLLKQDESGKWVSEDMFWDVWWIPGYYDRNSCTLSFRSVYKAKGFYANCDGKNSANENTTYTQRAHSNDDKVQLTIENDKIKVQTDSDIGYAVPAECNVDIILAIPVNGAASNKNNCDKSSPTSENPTVFCVGSLSASSMDLTTIAYFEEYEQEIQTPVWQIAKAFKTFLRDNFEFTRGVNVGLIPYSGKLSIPPHRKAWTEPIANFDPSKFLQNQNSYPAYIRGCFLYNTLGKENSSLSAQAYTYDERNPKQYDLLSGSAMIWGICSALVGNSTPLTGVMCRGKLSVEETYGDNKMCLGDLLSTADPATSTKFRRANNIPCYLGYANFLSMTCEKTNVVAHKMFRDGGAINGTYSSHYYSLPYFLIELQPDVGKICDLLTAIGPVFDDYNVSNFLFIPITWANNLLQSWTEDPACDAIDTIGSSPTEGQLSRPSKTTTGRKKALILVVNKPDWFEPGELTHLGFDNDFSEIPMIESDCIRFDIDYSDTSRKFANGSSYDGIIMGAKKILKYETTSGIVSKNTDTSFYECEKDVNCTGRLSFPQKYLVKIVVGKKQIKQSILSQWRPAGQIQYEGANTWKSLAYGNGKWMALTHNGCVAISTNDGATWDHQSFCIINDAWDYGLAYGNGQWMSLNYWNGPATSEDDGIKWEYKVKEPDGGGDYSNGIVFGNSRWMTIHKSKAIISEDGGTTWTVADSSSLSEICWIGGRDASLWFGNGKWMLLTKQRKVVISENNGVSWTEVESPSFRSIFPNDGQEFFLTYGNNQWIVTDDRGVVATSTDDGKSWEELASSLQSISSWGWRDIASSDNKLMALRYDGFVAEYVFVPGSIEFSNLVQNSTYSGNYHSIGESKTIYIEPSQISDSKDGNGNYYIEFNMQNIRLISAEITNRPYKIITPTCSLSGATNAIDTTGTAYITTNVKAPLKLNVDGSGSVTFSGVNGSSLSVSGAQNLNGIETFHFPAADFRANHTTQKVSFSLKNAEIIDATLIDQTLRCNYEWRDTSGDDSIRKTPNGFDEIVIHPSNHCLTDSSSEQIVFPSISGKAEIQIAKWLCCGGDRCSNPLDIYLDENILVHFDKSGHNTQTYTTYQNVQFRETTLDFCEWCSRHYLMTLQVDKKEHTFDFRNGSGCWITGVIITNNEVLKLEASQSGNNMWIENNCICFHGTGELYVTVKALGSFSYSTPTEATATREITSFMVITIDPDTYKYEEQPDGNYRITLSISNVAISDPKMIDTARTCKYIRPHLPAMSRVIDLSQNVGSYPMCSESSIFLADGVMSLAWNSNIEHWVPSRADYQAFQSSTYVGDSFVCIEDLDLSPIDFNFIDYNGSGGYKFNYYHFAGLHRRFLAAKDQRPGYIISMGDMNYPLGLWKYHFVGTTRPVNLVLWAGVKDGSLHGSSWQSDGSGNWNGSDATTACKQVTLDACAKLKEDWGNNLRIYIIKYRKQTQYINKTTDLPENHNYDYLDSCASGTGAPYIHDVADEAGLKTALQEIATNIKSWSRYTEAKNVE